MTSLVKSRDLLAALSGRDNALNFLRMVMAGAVIVSHAWPIGGFGEDPTFGGMTLGRWAVAGFFAISGYLITTSRLRTKFSDFMRRRVHRILPGLWAALIVTAVILAPVAAAISGDDYQPLSAVLYITLNSLTIYLYPDIPGTLAGNPLPVWNGSIHTLQHEMAMYVVLGLLLTVPHLRRRPLVVAALLLLVTTIAQINFLSRNVTIGLLPDLVHFGSFFAAGALLRALGLRVRVNWPLAVLCCLLLLSLCLVGLAGALGALPLAYLVLWLGAVLPLRWGAVNDYSYGLYVFAFPIQQLLAVAGAATLGVFVYIVAALMCTAPLAIVSWWLVERPALRAAAPRLARSGGSRQLQIPSHGKELGLSPGSDSRLTAQG